MSLKYCKPFISPEVFTAPEKETKYNLVQTLNIKYKLLCYEEYAEDFATNDNFNRIRDAMEFM